MTFCISTAAQACRVASKQTAKLSSGQKDKLLLTLAAEIRKRQMDIIQANQMDINLAKAAGLDKAMLERLLLNPARLEEMAVGVEAIAKQADPIGTISHLAPMPSGIRVGKMRIPLGVIAMIYESRPNVTIDAAALCLKAGNGVILRGGKEAINSNKALAKCIQIALQSQQIAEQAVTLIPNPDRNIMEQMLTLSEHIDLVIPRGGEGLIRYVTENSQIPVIQHFKGVCHLYVQHQADLSKALSLLENGKTQRTGVCNALETLLVDKQIAPIFLPMAAQLFSEKQVKVHACDDSLGYFAQATPATEADWHAEYLAAEIAVRVVDDYAQAIEHIDNYGSGHTEVIVTEDYSLAQAFLRDVDASVVMVNASSRFSDGSQLGLGAEIGISTSKLHAYGPMGATSLTTEKFVVLGEGQIRQ